MATALSGTSSVDPELIQARIDALPVDLERGQVAAIVHLVSSSVPRLAADQVSVVDQAGNLLTRPAGGDWSFGGSGELEPDLKGVPASAKLVLAYADGLVTGKLDAAYATKLVGGTLTLNAKAGVGEQPEPLKVWGAGSVDFKAAPWLKATVGLTLGEDGTLTVAGKLGIPAPVEPGQPGPPGAQQECRRAHRRQHPHRAVEQARQRQQQGRGRPHAEPLQRRRHPGRSHRATVTASSDSPVSDEPGHAES